MCYAASCNPLCGDCRPRRIVQARCPDCGFTNEMSRDEYLYLFELPHRKGVADQKIAERGGVEPPFCKACGAAMAEAFQAAVEPAECHSNRVICGFPCGRSKDPYREDARPCPTMVPLGRVGSE